MTDSVSPNRIEPVLIALGTNLAGQMDSPAIQLDNAIDQIAHAGLPVIARSRLYQTPCFPPGAGPDFVNAVVMCQSSMTALETLHCLHAIEAAAGRIRRARWQPRVLDLDLLAYGDTVLPNPDGFRHWARLPPELQPQLAPQELVLPHPRLHERAFVLVPLMDVAPDWCHPVFQTTVREMHAALNPADLAEITPISR